MLWIGIDRSSKTSLTKQVYNQIKDKILSNELESDNKLPPTRKLAKELDISRNIVIEVYEQLIAEGYLNTIGGSGTFVAEGLYFKRYIGIKRNIKETKEKQNHKDDNFIDFSIGVPDLKEFPLLKWGSYLKNAIHDGNTKYFNYTQPNGIHELRITLSDFLLRLKGIQCSPEQLFITSGAMHGFSAISKVLLSSFNEVIIEDPSFTEIHKVFSHSGYKIYPVPVDENGIQINLLPTNSSSKIITVTPSHHFPLGFVLPIKKRIQLIEYAQRNNIFIIENDYDSEFRFTGIPISSLQMLDPDCVIHIGTFSEILYPSVRLGYMIVPEKLITICMSYFQVTGHIVSSAIQLALLNFIKEGEFEKHMLRMKKNYRRKREFLINCLNNSFNNISISGDTAGLYIVVEFKDIEFTKDILLKAKQNGIGIYAVNEHAIDKIKHKNKILLGYGNLDLFQIEQGVNILKNVLPI